MTDFILIQSSNVAYDSTIFPALLRSASIHFLNLLKA